MTWIWIILIAFLAGVEGILDEFQFHQPLIACTLVGLATHQLLACLVLGGTLQMMALGWANIGASVAPDAALASIASSILLVKSGFGVDGVAIAIACSIPLAVAGLFLTMLIRTMAVGMVHRMDAAAQQANFHAIDRIQWMALCLQGVRVVIPAVLLWLIPNEAVYLFMQNMPTWLVMGLDIGCSLVVAVGYALVINMIATKEVWPFFVLGFVFAMIHQLTLLALFVIGFALAFLYIHFTTSKQSTSSDDPLGDILDDYE